MKIGTFTKANNGYFQGQIKTLTLSHEISLRPNLQKTENDKAPDYTIILVGPGIELGAGWNATSKDDNPYIKVKIDDPSLPSTLWAALTAGEEGEFNLLWTRPNVKPSKAKGQKETL
ncbi:MAG: DUF736 domain-containing protein [Pseudomonadota bacterium]